MAAVVYMGIRGCTGPADGLLYNERASEGAGEGEEANRPSRATFVTMYGRFLHRAERHRRATDCVLGVPGTPGKEGYKRTNGAVKDRRTPLLGGHGQLKCGRKRRVERDTGSRERSVRRA
jgi:hypothetical protein